MSGYRSFVFTFNNPTMSMEDWGKRLQEYKCQYIVFGHELAPTTGTPHYQGYVYWSSKHKCVDVRKKYSECGYWEPAIAGADKNQKYTTKDGNVYEWGTKPRQGTRSDLNQVWDLIDQGATLDEITEIRPSYQGLRMAQLVKQIRDKRKKRTWKPMVRWFWGPGGSGKTYAARELLGEDRWEITGDLKYLGDYDGEENVLFDDFRDYNCELTTFLKLTDNGPYNARVMYGYKQFLGRNIVITSPYHPRDMWKQTGEEAYQWLRRIDEIKEFKKLPKPDPDPEVERGNNKALSTQVDLIEQLLRRHEHNCEVGPNPEGNNPDSPLQAIDVEDMNRITVSQSEICSIDDDDWSGTI